MKSRYTGHKNPKMPNGQTLVEWLKVTMEQESDFYKVPMPTDEQIALVVASMRMHHLIVHAADYDFSELGHPGTPTKLWPIESSIGRFFRDAARVTLNEHRFKDKEKKF